MPNDVQTAQPGQRLERLGRSNESRKPEGGPRELTARHRLLVEYMLHGCSHRDLLQRITRQKPVIDEATGEPVIRDVPVEPGEPLTLIEAADVLRIRRRNARQLSRTRAFQEHMAAELHAFRDGEKARSLQTMVEVRDEPGFGRAADRKVRLTAAQMLMGESDGSKGPTVNIGISGPRIQAGIVIRMPARDNQPARTIGNAPSPARIEHEGGDDAA